MSDPTVSIVTRVCESELPYLHPFLEHHHNKGVVTFHLIIQNSELEDIITTQYCPIGVDLKFCLMSKTLDPNHCLKEFEYSRINTTYTFLLDVDEFFHSTVHRTIPEAMRDMGQPEWVFPFWIMTPADFNSEDRKCGYLGHTGKQIVKTKLINKPLSVHAFQLYGKHEFTEASQYLYQPNDCFIIHYWGRTFKDCLLKTMMYRGMGNEKETRVDELLRLSNNSQCANRLKLLALLNVHPRCINTPDILDGKIDQELESAMVERFLTEEQLHRLETVYLVYKSKITEKNIQAIYPGKGSLRSALKLLPD